MPGKILSKKSKQGKKNRASGARFELKVRNKLGTEGWIVDKWTNNVDLEVGQLIKVRNKFLGPGKPMMLGAGFPDFIAFKNSGKKYEIIGVEAKGNGFLDKKEKNKCEFLLDTKVFSKIIIAKKGGKRGEIEYIDFAKKHNKS